MNAFGKEINLLLNVEKASLGKGWWLGKERKKICRRGCNVCEERRVQRVWCNHRSERLHSRKHERSKGRGCILDQLCS